VRAVATDLPGVLVIEPDIHRDDRGFFLEAYHATKYRALGIDKPFVQDNHSRSVRGTLRGLHLQAIRPQAKLVRVVAGEVFDVAVDVRRGSPTFGRWAGVTLSAENFRQLYVPAGFAHGFCALSDVAEVEYKCTDVYDAAAEIGIAWDDPAIAIRWPVAQPILSQRDRGHRTLAEQTEALPIFSPPRAPSSTTDL
jgi:dTDP-4-dehydrorhamnose 3,5-epimerase